MRALFLVAVIGALLDLGAKGWARATLEPHGGAVDFMPFVSLRLTYNKGVSFGFFASTGEAPGYALILLSALVTAALAFWATRLPAAKERLALSFILAGALGNVIDRATRGAVTDYLDLHFGSWHPFVFNLADVWISLGVFLLLATSVWPTRPRRGAGV
ncbi:signal peptidase II [Sinorhizobium meliloti]|uniref:signal peptidase II n=1 Tax=Rhizobium meliloti TaxID=382 RepID=UPI00299F08CE